MAKPKLSIIGGGASAIAFALFIDTSVFDVELIEKKRTLGRKFLVAGKGGFNLTHGSPPHEMLSHYIPSTWMQPYFDSFTNSDFRTYLSEIGIETFVGSSNRVFPLSTIKPFEVLNKMVDIIIEKGVEIKYEEAWSGFNPLQPDKRLKGEQDSILVFALGGASWAKTGSDASWVSEFKEQGINIFDFEASNCGWCVEWQKILVDKIAGKPIKNIEVSHKGFRMRGELMLTHYGMEGGALYKLSPSIRKEYKRKGAVEITLDFKPDLSHQTLFSRIQSSSKGITQTLKESVRLTKPIVQILKTSLSKSEFLDIEFLVRRIKSFPIQLSCPRPIDEAISTVGGVPRSELDRNLQLNKRPGHYCLGEMIDWDAPTGGYLLQACFSMGHYLAKHLNEKYGR